MDINSIKDPKFLKEMNNKELESLAKDIRAFIIEKVSNCGGHLSASLGTVELIMALHKSFDGLNDKLLFDVGHQAYTHKILTGRAKEFSTLRQINGLSGYLKNSESEYDIFESGHSSTSISTAMGMAISRDQNNENYQIVSLIGDASIANGVAFEALNNVSSLKSKVIIVLNDNDMSISVSVGALAKSLSKIRTSKTYGVMKKGYIKIFNKIPFGKGIIRFSRRLVNRFAVLFRSSNIFDDFKISYLGPIDGHDFKALDKAFKKAKNYPESIIVHVKTKKGFGYKNSEEDISGIWHGVGKFDVESGRQIVKEKENHIAINKAITNSLKELMSKNTDINVITPAMISGSALEDIFATYPDRVFDVGIAEEHAVCFASGQALNKKIPFLFMYSTFLQRGYDEILHDILRINNKVIFMIDRAGVVGEDGETHQGIYDVSMLYPLLNTTIATIPTYKYIKPLLNYALHCSGPIFIRYPKDYIEIEENDETIDITKYVTYNEHGDNVASLIVVGDAYNYVKEIVARDKLKINVYSPILLKPLNYDFFDKIKAKPVYIYDNSAIYDGFTSNVVNYLLKNKTEVKYYTLPSCNITHGKKSQVLKSLHLDAESVMNNIKEEIWKRKD